MVTVGILVGAFLIAHGVVYGLYVGQAVRLHRRSKNGTMTMLASPASRTREASSVNSALRNPGVGWGDAPGFRRAGLRQRVVARSISGLSESAPRTVELWVPTRVMGVGPLRNCVAFWDPRLSGMILGAALDAEQAPLASSCVVPPGDLVVADQHVELLVTNTSMPVAPLFTHGEGAGLIHVFALAPGCHDVTLANDKA